MKFGIVGNNDGPLYLLRALEGSSYAPAFVGLQKKVEPVLLKKYENYFVNNEVNSDNRLFQSFDEAALIEHIRTFNLDLLINCFCNFRFNKLLRQSFDTVNIHLSLLPEYRGRHPLHWALINGERASGFSIHVMTDSIDAGEILWQNKITVKPGMSVQALRSLIMAELEEDFVTFIKGYAHNTLSRLANEDRNATYIPRRFPEDSKLTEWDDSQLIYRKIRAMRSEEYPAFLTVDGNKLTAVDAKTGDRTYAEAGLRMPFISRIREEENSIEIVCLDGKTIWIIMDSVPKNELSVNQKIY